MSDLSLDKRSFEERVLFSVRNFVEVQKNYGIELRKGKWKITDRAKLDRIFEKQPELKPVLRRLWTDRELGPAPALTHRIIPLQTVPSDKSSTGGPDESQEGGGIDRGDCERVDRA